MGRNFVFECVLVFFVFHDKSGITNNDRTGLNDITYRNLYSRDSNLIKKLKKLYPTREKPNKNFDFSSFFEQKKQASSHF